MALRHWLKHWGGVIEKRYHSGDEIARLETIARESLAVSDLVIVTGGASVGEKDFAKAMFAAQNLNLIFSKVAIKPGKPVWFGKIDNKFVLGLPGNPTSAMVTARLFLAPLLAALQGQAHPAALNWRTVPLGVSLKKTGDRETFVRARWDDTGIVPIENQESGAQAALSQAEWLIRCPAGQAALNRNDMVQILEF